MMSLTVMHWIHTMVEFSIIMMVIRVTTFPVRIAMMVTNIIMLVTWQMLLSAGIMMIGWLASHWCDVSWMVQFSMHVMMVVWLHLQHEVTLFNIGLGSSERCAIGIESGVVTLVPSVSVKCIEIIFPVEIEATCLMIIVVSFDIVIE